MAKTTLTHAVTRYEVATHTYGRKLITRDCPAQGLLEWPQHKWMRITTRPLGLTNAKKLADQQETHATVQIWMTAEVVYSNGKPLLVPAGWYPPDTRTSRDPDNFMTCTGEIR